MGVVLSTTMSVGHTLGMTIHFLSQAHRLLADVTTGVVIVIIRRWHASSPPLSSNHILIELNVGELLRVRVLRQMIAISAAIIGMSIDIG